LGEQVFSEYREVGDEAEDATAQLRGGLPLKHPAGLRLISVYRPLRRHRRRLRLRGAKRREEAQDTVRRVTRELADLAGGRC
jgi:hypothetical protein